jgi:hypothetical protein
MSYTSRTICSTLSFGGTTIVAYDLADLSSPKSYFLKASFNFKHPCLAIHGTRSWSAVTKHYSSHVDDMANMVYDEEVEFPYRTTMFDVYTLDFA